ncbi:tripartite motif-containing protein 5 isoform X2 [Desmodus rotundus]|uniref:tripartite motif-containing protein 5 isoform X2 n=1 Tax=Desmodus rotundus TaxID=9430 RepID=UPI00238171DA|nr:tripartite motif-containing protein 5-like isoform X2 [Desmodus rotundus]
MDFSSQESMKEVTCPICQELLTEPMSLDCGHSFCQDCITVHSESGSHLGCECYCPVCQSRYQPWNLRFNWQLAERLKKFREVDMSSHQQRRRNLCEHHGENCDIFCKDDGKAICRLCVQEHQGHQMSPIMEVIKECQEKLQGALKKLSQEQQEAEQLEADINEERATWKDVINILRRCEIYTLKKPKIVSNKLKSAFRVPDLGGMLQKFKEIYEPEEPQIITDRSRGAAVVASGILLRIKEEVTCPICLELLTEPMNLDCGHTFCQACITANNKESMVSEEGQSSCPLCRISYQPGNLRLNQHVANIVEMFQKVKLSPEEEQKTDLCERHGEKLLLFCKEDGKLICWLCERSQEHRGHHTFLMEEVAQEYQEKLQAALNRLRAAQKKAEKLEADTREERTSWKNLIQNDSQSVQDYFKKLRVFLDTEEKKELQKLVKEEGGILRDLEQSESELLQQSLVLKDLISELEHRLQGSMRKMLQDVNDIMERSKTFTLKKPKTASKKQERVFQAPDLSGMLQVFHGLPYVRRYWVPVTLDPPKDKPKIVISEDRRQMRIAPFGLFLKMFNNDYDQFSVLGSPFITSGKHYWEVDVSEVRACVLGVCGEKLPDSDMKSFVRQGNNCQDFYSRYQPKHGYWVIGLENKLEHNASVESSSSDPLKLTLSLTFPPRRVGVFLDYDAGTVSFFNITNHEFLIYKYSSCSFPQKLFPYFNMKCTGPMILCSPSS